MVFVIGIGSFDIGIGIGMELALLFFFWILKELRIDMRKTHLALTTSDSPEADRSAAKRPRQTLKLKERTLINDYPFLVYRMNP